MLIYQIYPRSFADANGDGVGDLRGIAARVPYIAKLGVEAVWISPFVQSPQRDFGYDVSDYRAVDPQFGTLADFRYLLKKLHAAGVKLIMDQVWCHSSDLHPWFKDSRAGRSGKHAHWYVWADPKADGSAPNNWQSYFGGPAWHWESERQQYYFHQFLPTQPTFNLRNHAVRKALLEVGEFWLKMGVDGFRLDAIHTGFFDPKLRDNPVRPAGMPVAPDIPKDIPQAWQLRVNSEAHKDALQFLGEIRTLADKHDAFMVGEVNGENPYRRALEYTKGKHRLHAAYNFGLLADIPDAHRLRETTGLIQGGPAKAEKASYALCNHDTPRVASKWAGPLKLTSVADKARVARSALVFGLALPGTYCMYQGEELGLPEAEVPYEKMVDPFGLAFYPKFKGRDGCRTPFPWSDKGALGGFGKGSHAWLPFAEEHRQLAVSVQEGRKDSTLQFARLMIAWRKREPLFAGGYAVLKGRQGLIGFARQLGRRELQFWFNLQQKRVTIAVPAGMRVERLGSPDAVVRGDKVTLAAGACVVLAKG